VLKEVQGPGSPGSPGSHSVEEVLLEVLEVLLEVQEVQEVLWEVQKSSPLRKSCSVEVQDPS
jgi:hypothetical protein